MNQPILDKAFRNYIFRAVIEGGLDPADCELQSGAKQINVGIPPKRFDLKGYQLIHKPSTSYFFWADPDYVSYPGQGGYTGDPRLYGFKCEILYEQKFGNDPPSPHNGAIEDFNSLINSIKTWSEKAVQWLSIPDLWSARFDFRELEGAYIANDNTPFSTAEQSQISLQIIQLKQYIRYTYKLSSEQIYRVEERLDEADRASHRIGRKDWILLFSGTIFSLIIADVITPNIAQHIFMGALHGLSHVFGIEGS